MACSIRPSAFSRRSSSHRRRPLTSAIPEGVKLRALFVASRGEAYVDLSREVSAAHPGGSLNEILTVYAVVNALTVNLPSLTAVQILVDGREVDTLAGHVDLRRPMSRDLRWVQEAATAEPDAGRSDAVESDQCALTHATTSDLRPTRLTPDFIEHAEGSVLIEVGETRVMCTASVEDRVPPFLRNSGKGWVTAEYGMLPRATSTRTTRESSTGKVGGRTQEIQRLIGRSLRSVTKLDAIGERTIWIDCDVIQADGGTRTASITGAFVALALAVKKLRTQDMVHAIADPGFLAATSVGIVDGTPVLDLCYEEDSKRRSGHEHRPTGKGRYMEVQGTAEQQPFDRDATQRAARSRRRGHRPAHRHAARDRRRSRLSCVSLSDNACSSQPRIPASCAKWV